MYLVNDGFGVVTMDESEVIMMWSKSDSFDNFKVWFNSMVSDGLIGILG